MILIFLALTHFQRPCYTGTLFWSLTVPVLKAGLTLCWNEFLYSLVFIQDELHKTLSVGVVTELIRGTFITGAH
jgi:ABC-type glycerol-3-phosphate transport system permease component